MADRRDELELAQKIVSSAEKLLHEVFRLRSDIAKLHARIEPFDNERDFTVSLGKPIRTMSEALAAIDEARQGVISAEYHLNAVRAGMDGISKDAISREEMKPYIKDR
jgi:hypothetical protein